MAGEQRRHVSAVPLSVVLAATHDSETLHALCAKLTPRLQAMGGELLIADGSRAGLGGLETAVRLPGADVFALRTAAAAQASGAVVAFTEDHCLPADDWCEQIVAAHERHRDQAAVAGCVTNGSPRSAMDWANFLMTFAPFLPPLPPRTTSRVAPAANVSIKRAPLDAHELTPGFVELELLPHLHRDGQLVYDDSVRVAHVQPRGVEGIADHFHNGRCATGLPRRSVPAKEAVVRLARSSLLPWRLIAHPLREVRARRAHRRATLRALPWLVVLAFAHTLGENVGIVFGPGRSPEHLD